MEGMFSSTNADEGEKSMNIYKSKLSPWNITYHRNSKHNESRENRLVLNVCVKLILHFIPTKTEFNLLQVKKRKKVVL